MVDSMLDRMAKALWDKMEERLGSNTPWSDVQTSEKDFIVASMRAALSVARKMPDMNAIMRVARETGMRPSEVDLAVTHWIDAILKQAE